MGFLQATYAIAVRAARMKTSCHGMDDMLHIMGHGVLNLHGIDPALELLIYTLNALMRTALLSEGLGKFCIFVLQAFLVL